MINYNFNQPPPSLKCVPRDADHITFELIFHPNQPFLDAKPWVGIWLHDYFHAYRIFTICVFNNGVRVPIFPIVVCVRSAYVIGAGVGFRVESGAVALLQLDL